jgi:hypothetical protein
LLAVVSDVDLDMGVPRFPMDAAEELASFLEGLFLKDKPKARVRLTVDGRHIPLTPFVMQAFNNTLRGFLSSLKGCEGARHIDISITPEDK